MKLTDRLRGFTYRHWPTAFIFGLFGLLVAILWGYAAIQDFLNQ